ncbi:MAG: FAD:protein FMN transferase [Lachnospiraceae bacterium]|nr:FAD:protein FMN transferase [Lachnospiraceae bacterium]
MKILKHRFYFFILLISLSLNSCSFKTQEPITKTGFYLDTFITISLYDTRDEEYLNMGMELCRKYDALLSKTNENSEIYKINHNHGQPFIVSDETAQLIQKGIDSAKKTDGLFDISIGRLSSLWDFKDKDSAIPDESTLAEARTYVDYQQIKLEGNTVTIPEGMELDLGGIGKGYIGDQLKQFYVEKGITSALLNLGGNILCIGTPPDREQFLIGIKKPFSNGDPITTVHVDNQCVVTSGVYERYFEKNGKVYHHILDPATGYPAETDLYSATIIADHSVDADILSTACLMMGKEKAEEFIKKYNGIRAVLITNTYEIIFIPSADE